MAWNSPLVFPHLCESETRRARETMWVFVSARMYVYLCVCASERVCILFMARNQLSLAHNGNVNSPERLSPTQGENWQRLGCILPNPNSEMEFAGLKSRLPLPSFSLSPWSTSRRCPYITQTGHPNRSNLQSAKHIHTHMRTHVPCTRPSTGTHTCGFSG